MVDSKDKTSKSRKSGSSGGSRKSRRSSSRKSGSGSSKSQSPHRSEPRRSKRSKEDLEAKERARSEQGSDNVESKAVEAADSGRKHRSSKRRSQRDRGVAKDNVAKAKDLIDRLSQPNTGSAPGVHADSRGDQVAKDNKSKGRFSRPLGTQSVFTMDERARMEAEKAKEQDGLVMATTIDESHDEGLAMALLNSMLEQMDENDSKSKETKTIKISSDSREGSKEGENEESEEKDWENAKLKRGVCIFRYLCCVIVLATAGAGTWIALRENNNSSTTLDTLEPSSDDPTSVTVGNNTSGPSSTQAPISGPASQNPSTISSAPSGAPISDVVGDDDLIFGPLSTEDCAAIANGGIIQGQDTMPVQTYLLDLDATPFLSMDLSISAGIVEEKLRDLLAPALTGCNRDARQLRQHPRHLESDDAFSYAIGNVMVNALGVEGAVCVEDSTPSCHRIGVALDIVVKDATVKISTVITELSLFLGGGVLANKLELSELYESIIAVNLGTADATESPSISDKSPSMEPTKAPTSTSLSTPLPTSAEVVQETQSPTRGSTPPPTPEPGPQATPTSATPTIRPTPFPTPRPSPFPTPRPVSSPTFAPDPTPSPSRSQTPMPSSNPTNAPAVPSASPSNIPSRLPSTSPTAIPTSSPTSGPTPAPSSQPTLQPSPPPSPPPTPSPTDQPSTVPSTFPPVLSISTDRCGYLESVLGNRASLHQLAFDWMCNTDTWEPSVEESYPEQWHDRYAVTAFFYASNNDNQQTFNDDALSDASTKTTCSWEVLQNSPHQYCSSIAGSKVGGLQSSFVDVDRADYEGYLPTAIGLLTNLQYLTFYNYHNGHSFPSEIGRLSALTSMSLYPRSYDTDNFPTEFGRLSRLEYLRVVPAHPLPNDGLRGTIPSALMSLTKLTWLQLGGNLTGTIPPSIVGLKNLLNLRLTGNSLTGTVPPLPTEFPSYSCFFRGSSFDDVTNSVSANCNIVDRSVPIT